MKISILGGDANQLCQIPTLRDGFASLGHQHVADPLHPDVSFAFIGNPPFDNYLSLTREKKTIFNVLDCPDHCREWPELRAKWSKQLTYPARVTTISKATQTRLRDFCSIDSEVIYYPMKPVHHEPSLRRDSGIKALLVGRVNDPEKRAAAAISALIRAGFEESEIGIVGPENPRYGIYHGVTSDDTLNSLYNSVDYVMMLSRGEGLGLPALEAACCGAIPIVAPDLLTFQEFWAESPLGLHYQTLNSVNDVAQLIRSIEQRPDWKAQLKQDFLAYATLAFRPKLEAKNVARRVLDIYHTI